MEILVALACFLAGYVVATLQQGITIRHYHNADAELVTEYHDANIDSIPPEIKQYLDETNGQVKF